MNKFIYFLLSLVFLLVHIEKWKNADEVENYCMTIKQQKASVIPIGILFNNMKNVENLPSDLDYTIRYSSSSEFKTILKYRFSSLKHASYRKYIMHKYAKICFFLHHSTSFLIIRKIRILCIL